MDYITEIKARLGSIAPSKMNEFPRSVQRLLENDMPRLLRIVEAMDKVFQYEFVRRDDQPFVDNTHLIAATDTGFTSKHP